MTNLFNRPNPKTATKNDIKKAIKEITDWDWTTGFSFAHIVIDDFNLDNGDILFCLQPSFIAETMNQKMEDEFGHCDYDKLEKWERNIYYDKVLEHMIELIELLDWLLQTPEKVRDEIE